MIVRENTEGMYAGQELYTGTDKSSAVLVAFNTRKAMLRICRYAFEYARRHGRKKVTAVHKANIMKKFSGILLTCFREVTVDYPDIDPEERIVDATCMEMVRRPQIFDVIVTTNLFGDILSDLVAGLVGGLGVAPGGNYGDQDAIFEAIHGSAPDIAGKNLANPLSLILSGNMMLRHLGEDAAAMRIEQGDPSRALRGPLSDARSAARFALRHDRPDQSAGGSPCLKPHFTRWRSSPVPASSSPKRFCLEVAEAFFEIAVRTGMLPIFKASFDKANRTSVESFRGLGMDEGLRILEKVRAEVGLPVTDRHSSARAGRARRPGRGHSADSRLSSAVRPICWWPPARPASRSISRRASSSRRPTCATSSPRSKSTGNRKLMLTERGASFGYHDLVVDMRGLVQMAEIGYPVVFDATHSVQRLGGADGRLRRLAAVHRTAGPRGRRYRRGLRGVCRNPSARRRSALRPRQHAAAGAPRSA